MNTINQMPSSCGKDKIVLGIETSCDETAAAVVKNGREVISNIISSQIDVHKVFGGVVPEIASRHHLDNINIVIDEALREASLKIEDIDVIGVTKGPGLVGSLLIGVAAAKTIAYCTKKPLVGVHHIFGHICANYISHKKLMPPFMALLVSGGHTNILDVTDFLNFTILGETRDDAMGEAYDKVARVLGLGYPGGPKIDKIAKEGNREAIPFKRVYLDKDSFDFSFSGTKTGVINYLHTLSQKGEAFNVADVAASFQEAMLEVAIEKSLRACKKYNRKTLVLAGGVAANSRLREMLTLRCENEGIILYFPEIELCTDNAAMIGSGAYFRYIAGNEDDYTLDAYPNIKL